MPQPNRTVILTTPFECFGRTYKELIFKPPSAALFYALGPLASRYVSAGVESAYDMPGVLAEYLSECALNVDDPKVSMPLILAEMDLEDGVAVRRTFEGFFTTAVTKVIEREAAALAAKVGGKPPTPAAAVEPKTPAHEESKRSAPNTVTMEISGAD